MNSTYTIAIQHVVQMVAGAIRRGVDIEPVLCRSGIAPELLESSRSRVTEAQLHQLIRRLIFLMKDEFIGLIGTPVQLGTFSRTIRLMSASDTLGDAIRHALSSYRRLVKDFVPRLLVQGRTARIMLMPRRNPHDALPYADHCFCFMLYRVLCSLAGRRLEVKAIYYERTSEGDIKPDAPGLYRAPIQVGAEHTGFDFDVRWLKAPVVQSREEAEELIRRAPGPLLSRYVSPTSYANEVRQIMQSRMADGIPTMEEVCHELNLSKQTLHRHLKLESSGYQKIKDILRRDAAIIYLTERRLSIAEISGLLDFSDASAFNRAFKLWVGQPPGAYRKHDI